MKIYRSTRHLLAEVELLLASHRPSARNSPLEDVIDLLCQGRRYAWAAIFLTLGENVDRQAKAIGDAPDEVALPQTCTKILISIRLASRELGVLSIESERENAFSGDDRVLLEGVADLLARFLVGQGKYLVRKARTDAFRMRRAGTPVAPSPGPM